MAYWISEPNEIKTGINGKPLLPIRLNDVVEEVKSRQLSKSDAYALLNERYPLSSTSDEDEFLRLSAMMEI